MNIQRNRKHDYDQDFELNRVTHLASMAQQAQQEIQKRMSKKQDVTCDGSQDVEPEANAERFEERVDRTPMLMDTETDSAWKMESEHDERSISQERNIRARSHDAMCETEEILNQIFAKADHEIESGRDEKRHIRAQSTSVVMEKEHENHGENDLTEH